MDMKKAQISQNRSGVSPHDFSGSTNTHTDEDSVTRGIIMLRSGVSLMACYHCKRRKIKCDKTGPPCGTCLRNDQDCRYPSSPLKPGPKLGSHRIPKTDYEKRHRREKEHGARYERALSDKPRFAPPGAKTNTERNERLIHVSSWIIHNFHEHQCYEGDPLSGQWHRLESTPDISIHPDSLKANNVAYICHYLRITKSSACELIELYFNNVTNVSLFHRPTFDCLIYSGLAPDQACCLVAAMFSHSARFSDEHSDTTRRFYDIACESIDRQLRKCGNKCPPLSLLQAMILTTFYELIIKAGGIAWRSLGACIRIAHEMSLHLVDAKQETEDESSATWCLKEERRRAWWAVWELEVFASTIRRAPSSLNISDNVTLLPIDDESWFNSRQRQSSYLLEDPTKRWKALQSSGNPSSKAWYLLINSLLNDAHNINNPIVPKSMRESRAQKMGDDEELDNEAKLSTLENCVVCFVMALPGHLRLRSTGLHRDSDTTYPDSKEGSRRIIEIMIQLARFMIFHHGCWDNQTPENTPVWAKFTSAADAIVGTIREASHTHIQAVNPLVISTYWMVAATQLVQKQFASTPQKKQLAQSNYDLVRLTIEQCCQFWKSDAILISNLDRLERKLEDHSKIIASKSTKEGGGDDRKLARLDIANKLPAGNAVLSNSHLVRRRLGHDSTEGQPEQAGACESSRPRDDSLLDSFDAFLQMDTAFTDGGSSLMGNPSVSDFDGALLNHEFPISMTDIFSGAWQDFQADVGGFPVGGDFLPI
ncbi:hypothetical protein NA57DRAFT_56548 [Rhizodiscina lignyota]|uniref:Zn(2)-C6 fungal-type domain-containing protein n=1 Tax=Rhizodiscina lignyota TaxID=1504668 RepID=A0A9P4II73_9PEZI|nr:hypothetical protein NA57DRAFT_56548 [Rhizodiscina lignyota]